MSDEEVLDRLLCELRQEKALTKDVHSTLSKYKDLDRLSTVGAIEYLVKHKRILDEIKLLVRRGYADRPDKLLEKIDRLLSEVD